MAFNVAGHPTYTSILVIKRNPKLLSDGRTVSGGGGNGESTRPTEGKMFPRGK